MIFGQECAQVARPAMPRRLFRSNMFLAQGSSDCCGHGLSPAATFCWLDWRVGRVLLIPRPCSFGKRMADN